MKRSWTPHIGLRVSVQDSRDPHLLAHGCLFRSCNPRNDLTKPI